MPGMQELMGGEGGAGIMCAVAAAFPDKFLSARSAGDEPQRQEPQEERTEQPWLLPPAELLYDMAGSVVVHKGYREADIDVGEVQLGAGREEAVPRLGVQLGVLRWLVGVGWGIETESVRLVGRKARSDDDSGEAAIDEAEAEDRDGVDGDGVDGDEGEDGR
jgi:hypothetical protein